jgi:hypothetical protein
MNNHQCKELHEAAIAVAALAGYVAKRAKDGIGLEDAGAIVTRLLSDGEFRNRLVDGVSGVQKVPVEITNEIQQDGISGAIREFGEIISLVVVEFQKEFRG